MVVAITLISGFLVWVFYGQQVSNGADIVMISKEFLIGYMSEVLKVKLQRKVMNV